MRMLDVWCCVDFVEVVTMKDGGGMAETEEGGSEEKVCIDALYNHCAMGPQRDNVLEHQTVFNMQQTQIDDRHASVC
jgi:hypothetical protein